ncbi:hypothetical protein C10C_0835 [Chlamydia serpentis]|uniref:Uncharacterized protein n=1 Tax=Chlamydia serpentis TaxID=1967782 RepID=A0A2R8FCJ3_9CHLA|nr:hypothetical protein [Chlamydia serpentis]SPN73977.1 hypothetical protein C10C_0835 [Chlamydia serpentis]
MGCIFYVIVSSILLGSCLGAYCQLYYSVKSIVCSWDVLMIHALEKRYALISLAHLIGEEDFQSKREIDFLLKCDKMPWRSFLKNSHDILPTFKEMEDLLPERLQIFLKDLENIQSEDQVIFYIENFWASKNLFDFEIFAYEQAVEKYVKLRQRMSLRLACSLFRFLDLPVIQFSR